MFTSREFILKIRKSVLRRERSCSTNAKNPLVNFRAESPAPVPRLTRFGKSAIKITVEVTSFLRECEVSSQVPESPRIRYQCAQRVPGNPTAARIVPTGTIRIPRYRLPILSLIRFIHLSHTHVAPRTIRTLRITVWARFIRRPITPSTTLLRRSPQFGPGPSSFSSSFL